MKEVNRYFYQHAEKPSETLNLFIQMANTFGASEVINWLLNILGENEILNQ